MRFLYQVTIAAIVCASSFSRLDAQDATPSPQRYAVLIGINNYTYLSDLKYCGNDMQALRRALLHSGFPEKNVTQLRLQDEHPELIPHRNNILDQLRILLEGVQSEDLVVVAFSGHGVHLDDTDYFCAIDSKLEDPEKTMIPVSAVADLLKASAAKQKLLIIDSCRNDPLPEGTKSASDRSFSTAFARSIANSNTESGGFAVMASCGEKQISVEDPELQHGVFMNFVANGLLGHADTNHNNEITLLELHEYAQYETRNHVRITRSLLQTPNLRLDITGDYVLARVAEGFAETDLAPAEVVSDGSVSSSIENKLFNMALQRFQDGKNAEAIREFEQFLVVAENDKLKRAAGLRLASAYLALDPIGNIKKALELHQRNGMPSVPLAVRNTQAEIKSEKEVRGVVKMNQIVSVTKVTGDWYLVDAVDGQPLPKDKVGYLYKTAFSPAKERTNSSSSNRTDRTNVASNRPSSGYDYGYGYGSGYTRNVGAGQGPAGAAPIGAYLDYHPNDRANVREMDRLERVYERAEALGASEARLREIEQRFQIQENQLETRQGIRDYIQRGGGRGGAGGGWGRRGGRW